MIPFYLDLGSVLTFDCRVWWGLLGSTSITAIAAWMSVQGLVWDETRLQTASGAQVKALGGGIAVEK